MAWSLRSGTGPSNLRSFLNARERRQQRQPYGPSSDVLPAEQADEVQVGWPGVPRPAGISRNEEAVTERRPRGSDGESLCSYERVFSTCEAGGDGLKAVVL